MQDEENDFIDDAHDDSNEIDKTDANLIKDLLKIIKKPDALKRLEILLTFSGQDEIESLKSKKYKEITTVEKISLSSQRTYKLARK